MKFNFDNLNKPEPIPEVLQTPEITQEEFDAQIEQEAAKLKTSVEELAREINKYGGPEEFKKKMESFNYIKYGNGEVLDFSKDYDKEDYNGSRSGQKAGLAIINDYIMSADSHSRNSKENLTTGGSLLGVGVVFEVLLNKVIGLPGLPTLINEIESGGVYPQTAVGSAIWTILTALISVGAGHSIVEGIKNKLRSNKEKREAKKQELKHKMTGVEFNK